MLNIIQPVFFDYSKGFLLNNGTYSVNLSNLLNLYPDEAFVGVNVFACGEEAALGVIFYYSNCTVVSSIGLRNSTFQSVAIPKGHKNIEIDQFIPPINTFSADFRGDPLYVNILSKGKSVGEIIKFITDKISLPSSYLTAEQFLERSYLLKDDAVHLTVDTMKMNLLNIL